MPHLLSGIGQATSRGQAEGKCHGLACRVLHTCNCRASKMHFHIACQGHVAVSAGQKHLLPVASPDKSAVRLSACFIVEDVTDI